MTARNGQFTGHLRLYFRVISWGTSAAMARFIANDETKGFGSIGPIPMPFVVLIGTPGLANSSAQREENLEAGRHLSVSTRAGAPSAFLSERTSVPTFSARKRENGRGPLAPPAKFGRPGTRCAPPARRKSRPRVRGNAGRLLIRRQRCSCCPSRFVDPWEHSATIAVACLVCVLNQPACA
jgi:hypothetical protein